MTIVASKYPQFVETLLINMLAVPITLVKTKHSKVCSEMVPLLENKFQQAEKALEVEQWLRTNPAVLHASKHEFDFMPGVPTALLKSDYSATAYHLVWNTAIASGPSRILVRKCFHRNIWLVEFSTYTNPQAIPREHCSGLELGCYTVFYDSMQELAQAITTCFA